MVFCRLALVYINKTFISHKIKINNKKRTLFLTEGNAVVTFPCWECVQVLTEIVSMTHSLSFACGSMSTIVTLQVWGVGWKTVKMLSVIAYIKSKKLLWTCLHPKCGTTPRRATKSLKKYIYIFFKSVSHNHSPVYLLGGPGVKMSCRSPLSPPLPNTDYLREHHASTISAEIMKVLKEQFYILGRGYLLSCRVR